MRRTRRDPVGKRGAILHDAGDFHFELSERADDSNRFTIVIGPNGSGKSQLLRSVAESIRMDQAEPSIRDAPMVLVLSNMVMDVFVNSDRSRDRYKYLGLREANNNTSTGALRNTTAVSLLECFRSGYRADFLEPVLSELAVDQISLRIVSGRARPRGDSRGSATELVHLFLEELSRKEARTHDTDETALALEFERVIFPLVDESEPVFSNDVRLDHLWRFAAHFQLKAEDIFKLSRRLFGLEFRLAIHRKGRVVELDQLSSGQILLLSTFARVLANVERSSVVLVDEPEVGLHPNWQSRWVSLMRDSIPRRYACHFFIASHSPYLVTGADDVLVPGDKWGEFVQFSEPFNGSTVEGVLYRVFGARVTGNLQMEKDLLLLVECLSSVQPWSAGSKDEVMGAMSRLKSVGADQDEEMAVLFQQVRERVGS